MSATQTITKTTVRRKKKSDTKKVGTSVAKAYSKELNKSKKSAPKSSRKCPTCGRPL